jgi:DNA-binding NarL/FixJ family response regulator
MNPNLSLSMSVSEVGNATEAGPVLQITPSERQALQLIAQGAAMGHICAMLGLAASDIDPYLAVLFEKFGATSRAGAIAAADRRGLLTSWSTASVHDEFARNANEKSAAGLPRFEHPQPCL